MFGLVTCVAEFVGGGIRPFYTVDIFKLFPDQDGGYGWIVTLAQILFVASVFYYIASILSVLKKVPCCEFLFHTSFNWKIIF